MRPLHFTHRYVSVNVCKQTTPEIPGSNLHEAHDYACFAQDDSDMGFQPGVKSSLVYFRSLHICQTTI